MIKITEWKKQLPEHATNIFSRDMNTEQGPGVKDLHARIGQLSIENDFLSNALGRIGELIDAFLAKVRYHCIIKVEIPIGQIEDTP